MPFLNLEPVRWPARRRCCLARSIWLLLIAPALASAAPVTWTGLAGSDFENPVNWSDLPANDLTNDTAGLVVAADNVNLSPGVTRRFLRLRVTSP